METEPPKRILFVCEHGALRCRIAAAYFNEAAPDGWRADTAGVTPQPDVSPRLEPLMAGTSAAGFLDMSAPKELGAPADRTVAIDVDLADAEAWSTGDPEELTDQDLRSRIEARVAELVRDLEDESAL